MQGSADRLRRVASTFRRVRRLLVPVIVACLVLVAGLANRELLAETWTRVTELSWLGVLVMFGCAALVVVLRALTLAIATPGLGLGRAVAADQAAVGATNGVVVGGGAVGTAAKVAMMRSWGVRPIVVGASVVATAVMPGFVTWGLAATVHLPVVFAGSATWPETIATVVGSLLFVGAGVFWTVVLVHPAPAAVAGRVIARGHVGACRRTPARCRRIHRLLAGIEPHRFTDELRVELVRLVRRRGPALLLGCLGYAAASFFTLWCTLHVMGVSGVSLFETLSVFTLVRILVAVAPVPGGVGVAEVGLVTFLVESGADRAGAAGAAVLFRAATWLVPIVLGATGWTIWHRRSPRTDPVGPLVPVPALRQGPQELLVLE